MHQKKNRLIWRLAALLLAVTLTVPVTSHAAVPETVHPMAGMYIDDADAWLEARGDGKVRIHFDIWTEDSVGKLGAAEIKLYHSVESQIWYVAKTYSYTTTSGMMAYGDFRHEGYVDFDGIPGRFYKATVTFYGGGTNNSGETRTFYAPMILSD